VNESSLSLPIIVALAVLGGFCLAASLGGVVFLLRRRNDDDDEQCEVSAPAFSSARDELPANPDRF
jgi:hypothetical protein